MKLLENRKHAGLLLSEKLKKYTNTDNVLILALPRGGVPIAYEVSNKLNIPFDIFLVRKLGVPGYEEFAMGAIASNGIKVINYQILNKIKIPKSILEQVIQKEEKELLRREEKYRGENSQPNINNKKIIIIDDGLATGSTMMAAISAIKIKSPKSITIAVPVSGKEVCQKFEKYVDEVICLFTPENFKSVGTWYMDFSQITDQEVINLLN